MYTKEESEKYRKTSIYLGCWRDNKDMRTIMEYYIESMDGKVAIAFDSAYELAGDLLILLKQRKIK